MIFTYKKNLAFLDTSGGLQTQSDPPLQSLAPEQKVAGVKEQGCVPQVFLGCPTTGRACANRCDHFWDIGDKPKYAAGAAAKPGFIFAHN